MGECFISGSDLEPKDPSPNKNEIENPANKYQITLFIKYVKLEVLIHKNFNFSVANGVM